MAMGMPTTFNPLLLQQQQLMQQQMLMASMPMMGMMGNPMMGMMMQQQQQQPYLQAASVPATVTGDQGRTTVYSKHDPRKGVGESYEAFCARLNARGAPWNWNDDSNPF